VNADVAESSVEFIDEPDFTFNPVGAKGLGEVARCRALLLLSQTLCTTPRGVGFDDQQPNQLVMSV
jgi:hypothetical protein